MKGLKKYRFFIFLLTVVVMTGCEKYLPEDREHISESSLFSQTVFEPVLGRTTLYTKVFTNPNMATTYPVDFKIVNMRRFDGGNADEITAPRPVLVWNQAYTGLETTLAEIEAKRRYENRPLFEIRKHSGDFVMWSEGRSNTIGAQPDSGYVYDVELSSSGGRRYFKDFKLKPFRERPIEPSTLLPVTGQSYIRGGSPSILANLVGAKYNNNISRSDIEVYIRKAQVPSTSGNTLKFIFLDTAFKPMNPRLFDETDWDNLVHGFNKNITDTSVVYTVAYPIPLTSLPTKYTTVTGDRALSVFKFSRVGFAGLQQPCLLGIDFAIYEKGDWEVVFAFIRDVPKFND